MSHFSHSDDRIEQAHKEHINKYKMAHCIGVAEFMRENAEKYGIDPDVAYTVGLLHDIGYLEGRRDHEATGADILTATFGENVDRSVINAIAYHGTNPYKLNQEDITPIHVLLIDADMSVNARGFRVGHEDRLKDIARRYGTDGIEFETASATVRYVEEYQDKQLNRSQHKHKTDEREM